MNGVDLVLAVIALGAGALLIGVALRSNVRTRVRRRLDREAPRPESAVAQLQSRPSGVLIPVLVGLVAAGLMLAFAPWKTWLSLATAFVFGAMAWTFVGSARGRTEIEVDRQLAEVIDLLVSSLRAGSSLVESLRSALRETRAPLRPLLEDTIGRLQLGDRPEDVFHDMPQKIPQESIRLFAFTLATHWEVGGNLAGTLQSIGRGGRDRMELTRRVKSQATEARFSVLGVVLITYAIVLLLWRTNPDGVQRFLSHDLGSLAAAVVIFMQGLGVIWMSRMSRLRF